MCVCVCVCVCVCARARVSSFCSNHRYYSHQALFLFLVEVCNQRPLFHILVKRRVFSFLSLYDCLKTSAVKIIDITITDCLWFTPRKDVDTNHTRDAKDFKAETDTWREDDDWFGMWGEHSFWCCCCCCCCFLFVFLLIYVFVYSRWNYS